MNKIIFYTLITLTSFTTNLFAVEEILQTLESFQEIECEFRQIERGPPSSLMGKDYTTNPHIRVKEGTSQNWSGYAAATSLTKPTTNSVTYVTGAWTIPTLSSTSNNSYSSVWVGIDGYSSGTVEQIGTEQDWINGSQQNYAWFEMYPNYSYEIVGFPTNNGDVVAGVVSYVGSNTFQLILINYTHQVFTIVPTAMTVSSKAKRNSAEWVVEAPYLNTVLPLADFNTVSFINCSATIKGTTGGINNSHWVDDALTMVTANNTVKAHPSSLASNGSAFSVTWSHE